MWHLVSISEGVWQKWKRTIWRLAGHGDHDIILKPVNTDALDFKNSDRVKNLRFNLGYMSFVYNSKLEVCHMHN